MLHVYHVVLFKSRARHSLGPRMFLTDSLATNVLHRILTSVIRLPTTICSKILLDEDGF